MKIISSEKPKCCFPVSNLNKHAGFTIIELVVVIVILAILSAAALTKYVNLSSEARIATIESVAGALSSTEILIRIKAEIEGVEDGDITIDGEPVAINDGYISGHWENAWRHALNLGKDIGFTSTGVECSVNDLCGVGNQTSAPSLPDFYFWKRLDPSVVKWDVSK